MGTNIIGTLSILVVETGRLLFDCAVVEVFESQGEPPILRIECLPLHEPIAYWQEIELRNCVGEFKHSGVWRLAKSIPSATTIFDIVCLWEAHGRPDREQ